MNTEALIDEIVTRLEPLKGAAAVEKYPNIPDWSRVTHPLCQIWAGYQGSQYDAPRAPDLPVQNRDLLFDVAVIVRNLNGHAGGANYLDLVRKRLHGFRLSQGTPLTLIRDRYVDSKNGLHRHEIVFATRTIEVPTRDETEGIKFTSATIESILQGEDTTIPEGS